MSIYWIIISFSILINFAFNTSLKKRFQEFRYLELGYLVNLSISIYLIGPALVLITSGYVEGDPISYIFSGFTGTNELDSKYNLLRILVFQGVFAFFYLVFRSKKSERNLRFNVSSSKAIALIFGLFLLLSYLILFGLSQGYDDYIESYKRYDHLNGPLRLFVSIIIRFKYSLIIVFLITLFSSYASNKRFILLICSILLVFEGVYSAGARITLLFVLIQIFFLYSLFFKVPRLNMKTLFLVFLPAFLAFFAIEKLRTNQVDNEGIDSLLALPGELGAVFFPSLHLYEQRRLGVIPDKEVGMIFFDFIGSFIPTAKALELSPMHWYQENYFPNTEVPPFTMGPIANTALWEGNVGILIRPFMLALLLASFTNYFFSARKSVFSLLTYIFVFSTSIMIMKYSIFYHVTPFFKTVLPVYLFFLLIFSFLKFYRK